MKIYLDLCVYNRPFDNQLQPRIAIETLEFFFILAKTVNKDITLVNSFVLEEENSNNPYDYRRDKVNDIFQLTSDYVSYSDSIENRAKELEILGIMAMDALHVACAEKVNCDFFVTCDDILAKKIKKNQEKIKVNISPLVSIITMEAFKI